MPGFINKYLAELAFSIKIRIDYLALIVLRMKGLLRTRNIIINRNNITQLALIVHRVNVLSCTSIIMRNKNNNKRSLHQNSD
jgi:hypothetical protein